MKTLKKALSIILCLALMLSCVAGMQISASAEEETGETTSDIVISTNTECNFAGRDDQEGYFANVEVSLAEATSFASLGLKVQYDSSVVALSYVSDDYTKLNPNFSLETSNDQKANPYTIIWYYQGNLAVEAGKIAYLNFMYKGDEIPEDFTTTVTVTPFDPFDQDGNELSLNAESFTVNFLAPVEEECAHEWDVVTATAATGEKINSVWTETAKGSIELKCSVCGEEVTKEVSYNDTYKAAGGSMSLEAQIMFNYYTYDSVIADADTVIFKTYMDTADPEDLLAYTKVEDAKSTVNAGQNAKTVEVGVPAKYMTEPLSIYVFVEKDGVWYSGRERAYSVAGIAQIRAASAGELEKKMYAALLTYGAKAQLAFNYKTDDLADSAENLGGFAAYVPTKAPEMIDDLDLGNASGTVRYKGCYYNLASATALGINLRTDKVTPTPDVSKITVDVEYTDYAGETQNITYSEFTNSATDTYTFEFAKLSVREWRNQFTMSVKYDGVANGSTLGGTIAGLAKWYMGQAACNQATATALEAMINYGDIASDYFDSLS